MVLVAWEWIRQVEWKSEGVVQLARSSTKLQGVLVQLRYSEILCTIVMHPFTFPTLPSMESLARNKIPIPK